METKQFLNSPINHVIAIPPIDGEKIGLELELEGRNVGLRDVATKGWQRKEEGSLRGEAIEYITNGAKDVNEAKKLVIDLFKKFDENKVKFNNSIRTSTHVHLNFSTQTVKQVVNFFSLFTLLEEVLQYYSGEDRKGNLFCISTREGEGIVNVVSQAIRDGDFRKFAGDRFKYAACNLCTLYKFGTVEIRTMRGADSAVQINNWIDILNDLYKYSLKMRSPVELINDLSFIGADALMRKIFTPANYVEVMKTFPTIRTLHQSLMDGARLIQVFAYQFEDAFLAEVKMPATRKNKFPPLPALIRPGLSYRVYRPDGQEWVVRPAHGGLIWNDGDRDRDESRIYWSDELQRFAVLYPDGTVFQCPWSRHHNLLDEGPPRPALRREMPDFNWGPEGMPEPEWDEDDDEAGDIDVDF
jgi:hypothetical protein